MKIQILDDAGQPYATFDGGGRLLDSAAGFQSDAVLVAGALKEASAFLSSDHHVVASIKADIQSAVSRIETELGAHPAFTWAQTKLGNAVAHLEAFVAGTWTEPDHNIASKITVDARGVPLDVADSAAR